MHLARKKSHQLAKKKLLIEYSLKLPQSVKHIEEQKLHLPAHLVGCCFHLIWRNSEGLEPKTRQGPPSEWSSESPSLCLPGADHWGNDSTLHIIASFKSHNQWRHRHREETSGPGGGRGEWVEGKGGMYEENNMETCTLLYVKYITNGDLLYDSSNSNQGSVTTWRGGMGREVQAEGDTGIPMADSC